MSVSGNLSRETLDLERNRNTELILTDVPYASQLDNPHTDGRYWASDPDRKDDIPDGCWMNQLPGGGYYGREAKDCPGPMKIGCIRPGSCNVTSLFMLIFYLGVLHKPAEYPDGSPVNEWLTGQPFSPTWLYVYMMDFWGDGKQLWDGINPTSAFNSVICARGDYLIKTIIQCARASDLQLRPVYREEILFTNYIEAIGINSPVVIHSRRLHHVILGIGYRIENEKLWLIAHDPYGRKSPDLRKWEAINGCGDGGICGQNVRYPFDELDISYMLYCEK